MHQDTLKFGEVNSLVLSSVVTKKFAQFFIMNAGILSHSAVSLIFQISKELRISDSLSAVITM